MSTIEQQKEALVDQYRKCPTKDDVYRWMIQFGKNMPLIDERFKVDSNLVKGCQSLTWLHAEYVDGKINFSADSEAAISKGVVAMLLFVYSGRSPDEILSLSPAFLKEVGISSHLSMNRSNGLASMAKKIQLYAYAFKIKENS